MRRATRLGALLAVLAGCSDPDAIVIEITTGQETDTFSMDPAVTRVDIVARNSAGEAVSSASAEPGGSFGLGEIAVDQFLSFEVSGFDAAGDQHVGGRSLGLVVGALQSDVFPVFAQRLLRWSRPPGGLPHGHRDAFATVIGERFLMVTGGEAFDAEPTDVAFYDLLALGGTEGGRLSSLPESIVVSADSGALLLIDDDSATWLDFDTVSAIDLSPPAEIGSWSQIAGGQTVVTSTASYVVGPTRGDAPSDRILVVEPDRGLRGVTCVVERQGAAATWIPEVGLAIAGGTDAEPGIEVLFPDDSATSALPFPADTVTGAAPVAGNQSREMFLLCGQDASGAAPPRAIDLGCVAECSPRLLDITLEPALSDCTGYRLDGGRTLLVGSDAEGMNRSLLVDVGTDTVEELLLREPRMGASVTPTPNGALALVGGVHADGTPALSVELLLP